MSKKDSDRIIDAVMQLEGVVDCTVKTNVLPNEVNVSHRVSGTPLREIVTIVRDLGYSSAKYVAQ